MLSLDPDEERANQLVGGNVRAPLLGSVVRVWVSPGEDLAFLRYIQ